MLILLMSVLTITSINFISMLILLIIISTICIQPLHGVLLKSCDENEIGVCNANRENNNIADSSLSVKASSSTSTTTNTNNNNNNGVNQNTNYRKKIHQQQTAAKSSDIKPHIVVILFDDLGYHDLGEFSDTKRHLCQTPVMNHLMNTGVKLKKFYYIT